MTSRLLVAIVAFSMMGCAHTSSHRSGVASSVLINRDAHGVGIQGYDPVAYFEEGQPVLGDPALSATFLGTTYHFSTEARRWKFQEAPGRFAPAFGGYCAYAAAIDRVSPIEPEFFSIVDERLVLNHNAHAMKLWTEDVSGNLAKADDNWPDLVSENGHSEHVLVNTDSSGIAVMGYDVVSYRGADGPLKGLPEHASQYRGATYYFASKANRATFESNPARFAPAYGGFCAYAVSDGRLRPIDPRIFQIEDDRLLLQHSQQAYDLFNEDTNASVKRAEREWPALVERSAS